MDWIKRGEGQCCSEWDSRGGEQSQGCFLLFLWPYLDPIKCVNSRYKQLERKCGNIIAMWAVLLSHISPHSFTLWRVHRPSLQCGGNHSQSVCGAWCMDLTHLYLLVVGECFQLWNPCEIAISLHVELHALWITGVLFQWCSAGRWLFRQSLCSGCWGHQSCYTQGTSVLLKNASHPQCTFVFAPWVWRDHRITE